MAGRGSSLAVTALDLEVDIASSLGLYEGTAGAGFLPDFGGKLGGASKEWLLIKTFLDCFWGIGGELKSSDALRWDSGLKGGLNGCGCVAVGGR